MPATTKPQNTENSTSDIPEQNVDTPLSSKQVQANQFRMFH